MIFLKYELLGYMMFLKCELLGYMMFLKYVLLGYMMFLKYVLLGYMIFMKSSTFKHFADIADGMLSLHVYPCTRGVWVSLI